MERLMALAMMEVGETRTIQEFHGKEEVKRHLQDLGFVKGEKVQVVGENPSGMILLVKGVRIALNRGLASQIMVAKSGRRETEREGKGRNDTERNETGSVRKGGIHRRKRAAETQNHGYGDHSRR